MTDTTRPDPDPGAGRTLGRGLKTRHITMMGLGSAIGTGLFIGTGEAISTAGPAALLSYLIAGIIVVLVMRMLGELGSAMPSSGSFAEYARIGIGRWAGFSMGWLYWAMLIMVLGAEVTAASTFVAGWMPGVPRWTITLVFVVLFSALNLSKVSNFGEFEFWFAAIKVAVIIAFLAVGVLLVFGWLPGADPVGLTHFTGNGGFMPTGWSGVASGLLLVAFAFGGIELVAIAAAESGDPERSVVIAVRNVVWRIVVFYLGSVAVMVLVLPWTSESLHTNPFVAVLDLADIPVASGLMQVVIVVALLSAFNAQMYGTARMVYSLAGKGEAPRLFARVSPNGSPTPAVLLSVFFAFVAVLLNWLLPDRLLGILMNAVGSVLLVMWAMITVAQLRLRPRLERAGLLRLRMWLHPYAGWFTLAALAALVGLMLTDASARDQLFSLAVLLVVVFALSQVNAWWWRRHGGDPQSGPDLLPPDYSESVRSGAAGGPAAVSETGGQPDPGTAPPDDPPHRQRPAPPADR